MNDIGKCWKDLGKIQRLGRIHECPSLMFVICYLLKNYTTNVYKDRELEYDMDKNNLAHFDTINKF